MNHSDAASHLANRLRLVMKTHAESVIKKPDVNGVGVAWRDGSIKFVVQTDSTEKVERLKRQLPAEVEGFPLFVEVGAMARAADSPSIPIERSRYSTSCSLFRRIMSLLSPRWRWIGFKAKSPTAWNSNSPSRRVA